MFFPALSCDKKPSLNRLVVSFLRSLNVCFSNNGKSIDQVFSEYQERQKMQAVENWLKYCKRPLPKCFKEFIEKVDQLS
jgi:hypothetical protein